jgi:branched-chain amino acid transport system substrate-binding protein
VSRAPDDFPIPGLDHADSRVWHEVDGAPVMRRIRAIATLAIACVVASGGAAAQAGREIKVGGMCDRTGVSKVIGVEMCPGVADYIALVNRKGGVLGHELSYTEVEHAYMVPRAVDAYVRLKQDGVVTMMTYGVPTLYGLTSRFMEDRIPAFNTGTGRSDAIDGKAWPYIFPGTASYWSQAGAALRYIKENGGRKGTKIAFLYYDNPAGREGLPMVEAVARKEGFSLRRFAVQPPGLEMAPQVGDIARAYRADWVIGSLFGNSAPLAIRELKQAGFPLNRVISFVYGAGDADVAAAGWDIAQGYLGLQYAATGRSHPVIREIVAMYRDDGKEPPNYVGSVYYNRGVLLGATIVEGIRLAIANHGLPLTGEKVRMGYEAIRNFDLQGFGPPLTLSPQDHEGGGYLRVYQVKGNEWVPVSQWIQGYRDEVMMLVRKANKK